MNATIESKVAKSEASRRRLGRYALIRMTGLLLSVLVLGHLVVTHVTTDVASTDASFVTRRWSSALWLAWDSTMLAAALGHAAAGIGLAVEDYLPDGRLRRGLRRGLMALTGALFVLGSYAIARAIY